MIFRRVLGVAGTTLLASGCASTQLAFNTVDVGSSLETIFTEQALVNLSNYIDHPYAIPSQIDLSIGTVQTTNSVSPTATAPLSNSITRTGGGAISSIVSAGAGLSLNASDAWQQNWNVSPVNNANTLRNLRALYRYAICHTSKPVCDTQLKKEYHVPRMIVGTNPTIIDPYMLEYPHCVLCKKGYLPKIETTSTKATKQSPAVIENRQQTDSNQIVTTTTTDESPMLINAVTEADLQPNENLHCCWLYWTDDLGSPSADRHPPPPDPVYLGHYGKHDLFISKAEFNNGYLANFVLFLLPNPAPSGSGAGGAGGGGMTAGGGSARRNDFMLPGVFAPGIQSSPQ
jgi:hypothetical protein